jgi:hypothetical protein
MVNWPMMIQLDRNMQQTLNSKRVLSQFAVLLVRHYSVLTEALSPCGRYYVPDHEADGAEAVYIFIVAVTQCTVHLSISSSSS